MSPRVLGAVLLFVMATMKTGVPVPVASGVALAVPLPVLALAALILIAAAMAWAIWIQARQCGFGVCPSTGRTA